MRLAARVHVELDFWMRLGDPGEQLVELRLVRAGEQRQHAARLGEQALDDGARDVVEAGSAGDTASPSASPRNSPSRIASPFSSTSREATVTSPVATAATISVIAAAFCCASRVGVEGDHRGEPGLDRLVETTTRAACAS